MFSSLTIRSEKLITDVVVIGGGAVGCSSAYYLSKHGFKVVVVERNELAGGASGTNAGIVSCLVPERAFPRFQQHCRQMLFGLREELETDIEFSIIGGVDVTLKEEMWENFGEQVKIRKSSNFPLELLDARELRKLVPGISSKVIGGIYDPYRGRINPFKLTYGYMRAAKKLGAVLQEGACVKAIKVKGSRVESVVTSRGEIKTKVVINAAGADADRIAGMIGMDIPIIPARGQILATEALPHILKYLIEVKSAPVNEEAEKEEEKGEELCYIQPTPGGNLLVGATKEYGVAETGVTIEAICEIPRRFANVFPPLLECNIIRSWAGIRPMSPDGFPLIGKPIEIGGFFIAAGHGSMGLQLASGTGEMIYHLVAGERVDPVFAQTFDPQRFNCSTKRTPFSSFW